MAKITVQNTQITVVSIDERDYISLTDMVRNIENGLALIEKWLRNKNTIEFLGIWESMYNPNFNSPEFEGIKNAAGLNRFILSVKQWVEKTNSCGIIAKAGRQTHESFLAAGLWDEIRVETGAMTVADGTRAPQLPSNVSLLSRETYDDNTLYRYVSL